MNPWIFSIDSISQLWLHKGQTGLCLVHLWIQSRWYPWLHVPIAILRPVSSFVSLDVYDTDGSLIQFLQIPHVSNWIEYEEYPWAVKALILNLFFFTG